MGDEGAGHAFDRHRGPVTCAVVAPSGGTGTSTLIVSGAYDGAVAISDMGSLTMMLLGYHDHLVNRVAVSPSGSLIASASSDYTIRIWDTNGRQLACTLQGHADDVEDFVFVSESVGISASRDRRIIVWDLASGAIERVLIGHERDALSVAYADGMIFSSGDDMTLRVWDLDTGRGIHTWGPFEHETDTCAVDPARGRVILGCDDGVLRLFDITGGETLAEIAAHSSGIKNVAVSPVTGAILSAAYDRRYVVWDATSLEARLELEPLTSVWERSLNWSPDGRRIVGGTFDGTIVGWNLDTGRKAFEIGGGEGNACLNDVGLMGDVAVTVADDGEIRVGELHSGGARWLKRDLHLEPLDVRVLSNAVAADAQRKVVLTGSHDGVLRSYRVSDTLEPQFTSALNEGPINSIRLIDSEDGYSAFAACYSGTVTQVTEQGEVAARLNVHDGAVKALCVLPARGIGVSCCADGTAASWELDSGRHVEHFPGHTAIINDLDVDQDGTRLATVGRDFLLNVHTIDDGRLLSSLPTGLRSPKSVCFATKTTVIVGDYWGYVVNVSLADGSVKRRRVAENGLSALARRADGCVVATSYDGSLLVVDPASLEVVQRLSTMWQRDPEHALLPAGSD